ncbi:MAG TPA: hypothetical protein VHF06_13730 [Pseudonocardiaceae bacterium]|jgi:hypothetical protein|nr:hypothetical protein [Pseudonocardiaceae bacterium]
MDTGDTLVKDGCSRMTVAGTIAVLCFGSRVPARGSRRSGT